ncbi:MAG TPA: peptidoglycan editing factor PgeF [Trueperaceae bacterium]|nr:peptidoglycan editing factor PgeF [Trueperaceae bacterium]
MPVRALSSDGPGTDTPRALTAPGLPWPHGFTLRSGGVSTGGYASLNLGLSSGDDAVRVEANRDRVLAALGVPRSEVCAFHQEHGTRVLDGAPTWFTERADAATSAAAGRLLVVSVADCLPLLFFDAATGAVGAAHCGWRGTLAGLAGEVVGHMRERYGTRPSDLSVAIGPGIQGACYQVGDEVVAAFGRAGFPTALSVPDADGRHRLDLAAANRWTLERAGVDPERTWSSGLCTHCDAERFYSHRRDAGVTGRHWAFIRVPGA